MFVLTSYEVPQRRLRLLSGDSETNLELGLFDFAFSPSSTRRRSVPQLEGVRKRKAARSGVRSHTGHRRLVARQTGFIRSLLGELRKGLEELQYVEGRDFLFELRWGEDALERLPILAADLVNRKVDVIVVASRPASVAACGRRFVLAEVGIIATRP